MIKKNKTIPIHEESNFLMSELFFSTTDLVGNILTGNNVFVRVSQFSKEELIGSPHNIIRHPDMPRIVFKVLWDYLKAGKVVIAYVKNMTKEGKYYWVLAVVFPLTDKYLSIRIKPSSEYFKIIPDLYKSLQAVEEAKGMDASLEMLLQVLKSKGFNDYDSFMTKVVVEELNSRHKQLSLMAKKDQSAGLNKGVSSSFKNTQSDLIEHLSEISRACRNINEVFNKLFEQFECLMKIRQMTDDTTSVVLRFSDQISILALNSSIETYRLGPLGSTLSVISKVIKKNSEEIDIYASSISKHSKEISFQAQQLGLLTSTSKIQSDMINFFAMEALNEAQRQELTENNLEEVKSNILLLVDNFLTAFELMSSILAPLADRIRDTAVFIDLINKIIRDLERSDVLGCIEASRVGDQGQKFAIVFNQMKESTEKTREILVSFDKYLVEVGLTINEINQANVNIVRDVDRVKQVASNVVSADHQVLTKI